MYYIYSDESGTSKQEPWTVVVGVIIHADTQWVPALAALEEIFQRLVPPDLLDNFIFHANDVWSGYPAHKDWTKEQRFALIQEVAGVPASCAQRWLWARSDVIRCTSSICQP